MNRPARLPLWQAVAYAAPALPFAMLAAPSLTIIPALYLSRGGIAPPALALGLLVTRTVQALTLPVAGIVSDRFFGTAVQRRNLLFVAALCAGIAWWQWLAIDAGGGIAGFIGWSLLLIVAIALFETNHLALASDMAAGEAARIRLLSLRSIASLSGYVACFALLEWRREADHVGAAALQWLTGVTLLLLVLSATLFALTPRPAPRAPPDPAAGARQWVRSLLILRDPHVRTLLSVTATQSLASGMTAGLIMTFMDRLLGLAWAVPQTFLAGAAVGMVVSLACPALVRGSSCRALLAGSATILALVSVGLGIVPLLGGGRAAIIALFVVAAMAAPPSIIAVSTLLARFVPRAAARAGGSQLATGYGLCAALNLVATAIGAAVAVRLIPERGAPSEMLVFLAMVSAVPALCHATAALIAWTRLPPDEPENMEPL